MSTKQAPLPIDLGTTFPRDAYQYGDRTSGETHGVVLTKPHVVRLILDLVGYEPSDSILDKTLLEPACGEGVFLTEVVRRLCAARKDQTGEWDALTGCVRAFDIDPEHVELARAAVCKELTRGGASTQVAEELATVWVRCGDFLLSSASADADFVVGNPPYIRIEHLAPELQAVYRSRFGTLYDRADLYVAFIEQGLSKLTRSGKLGYVCADRWTLNRYGRRLRGLIASEYGVHAYVDLHKASPFESDVIAYPAIFVLGREQPSSVRVLRMGEASADECADASRSLRSATPGERVEAYPRWFSAGEPWVLGSPRQLAVLRDLESRLPSLEESPGTKVGIGVATGNDGVFIVDAEADIEPDRLVPLVMRPDLVDGRIQDQGHYVINTFETTRGAIDLAEYPRLAAYFDVHADEIRGRHVAQKNPSRWFRTIDRVYPELVCRPKLLIPDIAGSLQVAYDRGQYHPHHNLYFVVSDCWDLEVLGALLSSRVALFFVWCYAVKMRGGYLRFQAQYLRRIRVPAQEDIPPALTERLRCAFRDRDFSSIDRLALQAYELDELPEFEFVDTRR